MKTMKLMPSSRSAGLSLGLLVAAGLLSCCKVTASTSSAMDSNSIPTSCDTNSTAHLVGNGLCDHEYNSAECGYDGGDCCPCTCTPGDYDCGALGFACIDPEAPCMGDNDVITSTSSNCFQAFIGDGECDQDNNNELCGYDGGDCCSCTCASDAAYECGVSGYACIDPEAPCVDDDDVTEAHASNCYAPYFSDGLCDPDNNNELCGYDGGDCCSCTCTSAAFECGVPGYACIDPEAPCVDDDDITLSMAFNCIPGYIADGYCDWDNNNELCGYDGGDCCSCTCTDGEYNDCGVDGYACADPEAPCVDEDAITTPIECVPAFASDGFCDSDNNNALCGYDGGDCCSCTCASGDHGCGEAGFDCIDPEAPCVDPAKADQHSAAQPLTKFSTATFIATFAAGLGAMHLLNLVS